MKKIMILLRIFIVSSLYSSAFAGNIALLAGTGTAGFSGDTGQAISAQINAPRSVYVHSSSGKTFLPIQRIIEFA